MTAKTRYAKTWLAGTALAAMVAVNTANAGELYVANLSGNNFTPASGAAYTGTGYFVLNNGNASGSTWFTHNIPSSVLTSGQIERADRSMIYNLDDLRSPSLTFPNVPVTASDLTLLRSGGIYMDFYTSNFPTGAIRGAFTRSTFAIPTAAANRVQYGVAVMVNEAMGSSLAFDEVIVDLAQLSAADQLKAYEELSGRTLYSQSVQVLDTLAGFQNSLFSHANDTTADLGTFNVFARGGYTVGKRDDTRDQAGASLSRPYIIGGIDTTFLPNASAGIAVAYADGTDKFRNNLGQTSVSTIAGLGYVSLNVARVVVQGVVGYGKSEIATTRNMPTLGRLSSSRHNGDGWSMAARVAMPFAIGPDTTLSPYALLDTQNASIDAYTETSLPESTNAPQPGFNGRPPLGAAVQSPDAYKDKDFGVELGAMMKAKVGQTAQVRVEAGYRQSLDNGMRGVRVRYAGVAVPFEAGVPGRSPNAVRAGVAISGDFGDSLSGEVGYQGYMSGRMNAHAFEARLTFKM